MTSSIDVDPPEQWVRLDKSDRHSTVAHFIGGYEHRSGQADVLVWAGVSIEYAIDDAGEIVYPTQIPDDTDQSTLEWHEGIDFEGVPEQGPEDGYKLLVTHSALDSAQDQTLFEDLQMASEFVSALLDNHQPDSEAHSDSKS